MGNTGTATGTLNASSTDSTLSTCLVTGFLKDLQGLPLKGYTFYIRHVYEPLLDGTVTILQEKIKLTTDSSGKITVNLIRGSKFKIEFPDKIFSLAKICCVPDEATASLSDITFPRFVSVAFTETVTTMSVGETQALKFTSTLSDGQTETSINNGVTLQSSNTAVLEISGTSVVAKSTGTATITISAFDVTEYEIKDQLYDEKITRLNRVAPSLGTVSITVA